MLRNTYLMHIRTLVVSFSPVRIGCWEEEDKTIDLGGCKICGTESSLSLQEIETVEA